MRKLLLVSHFLPPSRYGQPRVIQRLLQDMPVDGYALASVEHYDRAVARADQDAPWLPGPYLKLDKGGAWPIFTRYRPFNRYALVINAVPAIQTRARQIAALIESQQCDVAIACSGDIADLPATWLACRRTGARFVAYMFDDYVEQWAFQPALRRLAAYYESRFIDDAAQIVVPNEFLRREYEQRHGGRAKLCVINNPWLSDPGSAPSAGSRPTGDPAHIVYTGSIYDVHIDAFRNLSEALRRLDGAAELDVYSATTAEAIKANGIDRFRHHGHVEDAKALEAQRNADILFLPLAFQSKVSAVIRTSAPGKMGEYLASGRPVLVHAPEDTFISWYCRHNTCAEVVTECNPDALATAIRRLISDRPRRDAMVASALARAQADFSPQTARRRFAEMLNSL